MPFMKYLSKIHRCANLYRSERYAGTDIGCYEDTYIINICKNEGVSQDALAKIISVHKSNVARHMAALEEKGYVERRPDGNDRRSLLVYPTKKAKTALIKIDAVFSDWNRLLLEEFDDNERNRVSAYLKRLAARAEKIAAEGEKK